MRQALQYLPRHSRRFSSVYLYHIAGALGTGLSSTISICSSTAVSVTVHSNVKRMPAAAYGTLATTLVSSAPRATEIPTQIAVTVANDTAASRGYFLASA